MCPTVSQHFVLERIFPSGGGELEGTKRLKGQRDAALALAKRTLAEHGYVPVRCSVHDRATRGKLKHMQSFAHVVFF